MFENSEQPGEDATVDVIVNAILRQMHLLLEEHHTIMDSIREGSSGREQALEKKI